MRTLANFRLLAQYAEPELGAGSVRRIAIKWEPARMEVTEQAARRIIENRSDRGVALKLRKVFRAGEADWPAPWYAFAILVDGSEAGGIRLRVGNSELFCLWAGHIGFNVEPNFRGHRVAERATRLVLPLARFHALNPVWLTCNPDNVASQITLRRLGAEFVETVFVPPDYAVFEPTATQKQRYRLQIPSPAAL